MLVGGWGGVTKAITTVWVVYKSDRANKYEEREPEQLLCLTLRQELELDLDQRSGLRYGQGYPRTIGLTPLETTGRENIASLDMWNLQPTIGLLMIL